MTAEILQGSWAQIKNRIRDRWKKLTEEDLIAINGNRDMLILKLCAYYGYTKEQATNELYYFLRPEWATMLRSKNKSSIINKKRILLATVGALLFRQGIRFWIGEHKTSSTEWRLLCTGLISLILLIVTFWTLIILKLSIIFFQHFGTGWLPLTVLLIGILLSILALFTGLKNYIKFLMKKWLKGFFLLLSGI
jgi:uncharacterized protein YjbJ (UPF0337 family)